MNVKRRFLVIFAVCFCCVSLLALVLCSSHRVVAEAKDIVADSNNYGYFSDSVPYEDIFYFTDVVTIRAVNAYQQAPYIQGSFGDTVYISGSTVLGIGDSYTYTNPLSGNYYLVLTRQYVNNEFLNMMLCLPSFEDIGEAYNRVWLKYYRWYDSEVNSYVQSYEYSTDYYNLLNVFRSNTSYSSYYFYSLYGTGSVPSSSYYNEVINNPSVDVKNEIIGFSSGGTGYLLCHIRSTVPAFLEYSEQVFYSFYPVFGDYGAFTFSYPSANVPSEALTSAYSSGYSAGYSSGYSDGVNGEYSEAYDRGYQAGLDVSLSSVDVGWILKSTVTGFLNVEIFEGIPIGYLLYVVLGLSLLFLVLRLFR